MAVAGWISTRISSAACDSLFLALVTAVSAVLYVGRLGFYSDDWSFLAIFHLSPSQSPLGFYSAAYSPHVAMRPVQILYQALLYWLFGDSPLGYQLTNQAVLTVGVILFYLTLRRLGTPRFLALAGPLVWGVLPHYTADRFWYSAFQATLSVTFYIASLYFELRGVEMVSIRGWMWKLMSALAAIVAALAYEVILPLFLLSAALVWAHTHRRERSALDRLTRFAYPLIDVGLGIGLGLFKQRTTVRQGNSEGITFYVDILRNMVRLDYRPEDYGLNIKQALAVNYGYYGLRLPVVAWKHLREYAHPSILAVSLIAGLLAYLWLSRLAYRDGLGVGGRRESRNLCIAGVFVFMLGYAIFLTNWAVQFTPTGIGNRTAIAAAAGVALSFVGFFGWLGSFVRNDHWRAHAVSGAVALVVACSVLIVNSLALFWGDAWTQERQVLTAIERQFPASSQDSAIILDGVCPYVGPAVVFESGWDLAGALQIRYGDPTLRADVLSSTSTFGSAAIATTLYNVHYSYSYSERTFIFNAATGTIYPLPDSEAAQRYRRAVHPSNLTDCPHGHEGLGVPIF